MNDVDWMIQAVRNRIYAIILDNEDYDMIADCCRERAEEE